MKTILKICGSDFSNESRDKRELSVFQECGYEVLVLAKGNESDRGREEIVDGLKILRYTTRPLGRKMPNILNRFVSLFQWANYARSLHPDVISGHDLIPGLTIAWFSTWFAKRKPKLIYDSHEFELGRNKKRNKIQLCIIKAWEGFLIQKCVFCVMVNDIIADEVKKIYRLGERPVVIRSTPNYWAIDDSACHIEREQFFSQFSDKSITHLVMFHGNIRRGVGIESSIKALKNIPNLGLVLLGQILDKQYFDALMLLAKDNKVEDRVIYHEPVSITELCKYIGAMDIEIMMIEPIVKSYYYSLPNKMFEAIQSEVPIVASDLPEMNNIIEKYGVGLTCEPGDISGICNCLGKMMTDSGFYSSCKRNVKNAKEDLCWEKEKEKLKTAIIEKL